MKDAYRTIVAGIENYSAFFSRKDAYADCALHVIVGKIGLAVQLELISIDQADKLIDKLFARYEKLEKL